MATESRVNYSSKTIEAYIYWIVEFIRYSGTKPPEMPGEKDVEKYLTYLAVKRNVAPSTQNQALAAILYLYNNIVNKEIGCPDNVVKSKRTGRLPFFLQNKRCVIFSIIFREHPNWFVRYSTVPVYDLAKRFA